MAKKKTEKKRSLWALLRNYFITGLVVLGPIGLTFLLIRWVVGLMDAWFPLTQYLPYDIPGVGLVVAVLVILITGALTANFVGRALLSFGEDLLSRMPGVGKVYSILRQIFKATIDSNKQAFSKVALVQYPREGVWVLGFISTDIKGEIESEVGSETMAVFVPTTPNPTSGFLLFFPKKDIKILSMSVEEGAKLVISAGLSLDED